MIDGTLELRGNVKGKHIKVGRVELDSGVIESDIECADYISVGQDVTIFGNVSANNADIDGAINGDLIVTDKVNVGSIMLPKDCIVAKVSVNELEFLIMLISLINFVIVIIFDYIFSCSPVHEGIVVERKI